MDHSNKDKAIALAMLKSSDYRLWAAQTKATFAVRNLIKSVLVDKPNSDPTHERIEKYVGRSSAPYVHIRLLDYPFLVKHSLPSSINPPGSRNVPCPNYKGLTRAT